MNSCLDVPQFFFPSQCKAKLANPCTKVVDFCPCTHNPPDFKQVATILNTGAVKWAVDSLQGGENESRVGRMKAGWGRMKAGRHRPATLGTVHFQGIYYCL